MSHAVGSLLVRSGILDEVQLRSAIARQRQWGGHLLAHVVRSGMLNEEALVTALADRFSHPAEFPLPMLIEQDTLVLRIGLDEAAIDTAGPVRPVEPCVPVVCDTQPQ